MNRTPDQAAGLRRMLARNSMRVFPLASVLDRPAQARLALHIAAAHAHLGARVMILDASRGDVASLLGLRPKYELLHLLQGEKQFDEVVLDGPDGLLLVPAARGIESMEHADDGGWQELFGAFAGLSVAPDLVLLNSAHGDSHAACRAAAGVHEVVLALDTHTDSVTAAYVTIKAALKAEGQRRYRLVFSDVPADFDTGPLVERMTSAAQRFLGAELRGGGVLPFEPASGISSPSRTTLVASDPTHPAAQAFLTRAGASIDWSLPEFSRPAAGPAREANTA